MNQHAITHTPPRIFSSTLASLVLICFLLQPAANSNGQDVSRRQGIPPVSAQMVASTENVYHHSVFDLTLEIMTRNVQLGPRLNLDPLPDPSVLKLSEFTELATRRQREADGTVSEVRRFRCRAEAMKPGSLTIAPKLQFSTVIRQRSIYFSSSRSVASEVSVRPLTLVINPLPTRNRPGNFSGAVGSFEMKTELSATAVAVNELVTSQTRITGKGYLTVTKPPEFVSEGDLLAYAPKIEQGEGELLVTQTIIPQSTNVTAISPITFCFFDPQQGQYRTLTQGPFPLRFLKETKQTELAPYRTAVETSATTSSPPISDQDAGFTQPEILRIRHLRVFATVLTGIGCILLGISLFHVFRNLRSRRKQQPVKVFSAIACLFLAVGWALGHATQAGEAYSSLERDVTARLGPSHNSAGLFEISAGEKVQRVERAGTWISIRHGENRGWILEDSLSPDTQPLP